MEDNLHVENGENLVIDWRSKEFLKETAKWTKFLAILGFVGIGLMVLGSLVMLFAPSSLMSNGDFPFGGKIFMMLLYLAFAVLYYFPISYLYQFSENTKKAIENNDNNAIRDAFEFLKSHYKFMGILTIILLSFYAIMIFIGLIGAGAAAMMN
ncbi:MULTISPECIES: DUF5362 family protein [Cloacibacterium]|uniref:DUF5362 domain-containing protein n=1 Tax=Cloacibacterium normanense TaxID=237258 RepID=A0A1E5UCB2_9FLAO|nr:DUF5362 family protein [Cloacibacterium normanense]AZI70468.1 hypothetical protein EB819_11505 [Cloacibacterium normanense]OEL10549.1 hypothetical protein BHF72_0372 [Cloacibacterium normanense]SDO27702.1 hypothetical protein SAMN04489756_10473 [Cloacibacterium normanense]